jgi:hypothetical protein
LAKDEKLIAKFNIVTLKKLKKLSNCSVKLSSSKNNIQISHRIITIPMKEYSRKSKATSVKSCRGP